MTEKEIIKVDKKKVRWVLIGLGVGLVLGILVIFWLGGDIGR